MRLNIVTTVMCTALLVAAFFCMHQPTPMTAEQRSNTAVFELLTDSPPTPMDPFLHRSKLENAMDAVKSQETSEVANKPVDGGIVALPTLPAPSMEPPSDASRAHTDRQPIEVPSSQLRSPQGRRKVVLPPRAPLVVALKPPRAPPTVEDFYEYEPPPGKGIVRNVRQSNKDVKKGVRVQFSSREGTTFLGPVHGANWRPVTDKCLVEFSEAMKLECADTTKELWKFYPQCSISRWCAYWSVGLWRSPFPPISELQKAIGVLRTSHISGSCTPDMLSLRTGAMVRDVVSKLSYTEPPDRVLVKVDECSIHSFSPLEIVAILSQECGDQPIVFSGDSMIRQSFQRLVHRIRGSDVSIDPSHFHTDIVYIVGTKGDYFSVLPDAIKEVRSKLQEQTVGDEYVNGFDYAAHMNTAGVDLGDMLFAMHFVAKRS